MLLEMGWFSTFQGMVVMVLTIVKYFCMIVSLAWYFPYTYDLTYSEPYLIITFFAPIFGVILKLYKHVSHSVWLFKVDNSNLTRTSILRLWSFSIRSSILLPPRRRNNSLNQNNSQNKNNSNEEDKEMNMYYNGDQVNNIIVNSPIRMENTTMFFMGFYPVLFFSYTSHIKRRSCLPNSLYHM